MNTQTTQLRVTLPVQLQGYLRAKASKFGLSLSAYVKNLILADVQDVQIPVYKMNAATEAKGLEALAQHRAGETTEIKNIDDFLNNL